MNFNMNSDVFKASEILYDYLKVCYKITKSDVIIGHGSADTGIALLCCKLFKNNYAKYILFTGYKGKGTINKVSDSEAEIFKKIAISNDIDESNIITESKSFSTNLNVKLSIKKLKKLNIKHDKIIAVHKPYACRRCKLIYSKYNVKCFVTCDNVNFKEYVSKTKKQNNIDSDEVINELTHEIFMLKHYRLFFLSKSIIPSDVICAYEYLKNMGYKKYII